MSTVYFNLSGGNFFQDWSNTGLITTNDNWAGVPSITGHLGDSNAGTPADVDPRTLTADAGATIDVIANLLNSSNTSGGVGELQLADPAVALQGSGTADAPYLVVYLDTSGRQSVNVQFDARDMDSTIDNAAQQINVQYRVGGTGPWTNVTGGYVADVTTGGTATQVTHLNVTLPAAANNQPMVEVRIMTTNAGGSDEWVGIDNIAVTSTTLDVIPVQPGTFAINDVAAAEGDSGTTAFTFTVTRSGGSDGAVSVNYSLQNVTTNAADFSSTAGGTVSFAAGETSKTITIDVVGDLVVEPNETFTVVLDTPTGGATIADGSGLGTVTSDDLPPIANVWINEFHYDPSSSPETGEFIEVAGLAGIDLAGWTIVLYNGNGGGTYGSAINLSGTLANGANGFGFTSVLVPGFQNGSPDGFALVDNHGRVVQFLSYEGTITAINGPAAGRTSTDILLVEEQATPGTSLQLTGTGSTYADFTWTAGNANTSGGPNADQSFLSGSDQGEIRLDNGMVTEGNAGETMLTFVVHRAGGFDSAATVDYSVAFGTADAADLGAGAALVGSVTFAAGEFTQTIGIPVSGDLLPEFNETLFVTLGTVTGNAVVVDAIGVGTIINDDLLPLTIMQIQGETHWSEFAGQPVVTTGIVTAIDSRGFFLQDAVGDGNENTSDAVYVFTGSAPTVRVGDSAQVTGRVSEFGSDLPLTEINVTGNTGFGVSILSTGNALPAAVLVGTGGRLPPTESIDSDGLALFNPAVDGADFWESLEAMRVSIDTPLVVANSDSAFGETYVVASLGLGATGVNSNGGITVSTGDYNPEMIQLDDVLISGSGFISDYSVGDQPGTVIGVINYSFSHYELLLTEVPTGTVDVTLTAEVADFAGDANFMTFATFNVENLDPSDGKYDELADDIVVNLRLPDVIAIQEMQDDNGALPGGTLGAANNAQGLIDAIYALSGITYVYAEIAPTTANSTGGEPNGNIRNGYLYRDDRVDLVAGSLQVITDASYTNSRLPLVATWSFQGSEITTINVHLTARSGSDPLWGETQPPEIAGEDRRADQLEAIGQWINAHLADDPALNIAVLGDFNGFYFEAAQTDLTDTVLTNLQVALLDPAERYSYLFEGNSQLLDNILVTDGLLNGAMVDGVHINAYFGADANSDHDPQVASFLLGTAPTDIVLDGADVDENLPAGTVVGTASATDASDDILTYSLLDNGGRFAINAATGVITTLIALDHEALASANLVVVVSDAAGQTTQSPFVITINDVNEAPVAVGDMVAVNEDATSGNLWTQLLSNDSDPDAGDSVTIQSVGTAETLGSVLFDTATQSLRYVADHDSFDSLAPGATATDTFTYTVVDSAGLTHVASVTVTVTGLADGVRITAGNGNNVVTGTAGEDFLYGENGNDTLSGGSGHDLLDGGRGNDVLNGQVGNDTLIGGRGDDRLTGGDGSDVFVFGATNGHDVVVDFNILTDTIRLSDGITIWGSSASDVNGDGLADLRLDFGDGGSATLLGISSLAGVTIDSGAANAAMVASLSPIMPSYDQPLF